MRWLLPNNKLVWKSDKKYLIDWDKPSRSKEQTVVKNFLRQFFEKDVVYEEYVIPRSGKLRVDFLNVTRKYAIEHQGDGAHNEFNPFFHKNSRSNFLASIKRDVKKATLLELNGYLVIETYTKDLNNLTKEFFLKNYNIVL
jgi:hypothetical protein